jgi:hypothetical protein
MYPNKSPALSVIAALNVSSEPSLPVIFQFFAVSSFAFLKVNHRWPLIRKAKLWLSTSPVKPAHSIPASQMNWVKSLCTSGMGSVSQEIEGATFCPLTSNAESASGSGEW